MTPAQVETFLKALGVPKVNKTKRGGWTVSRCPLPWRHDGGKSGDEVFGVDYRHVGEPIGFCFSCGWKGKLGSLPALVKFHDSKEPTGLDFDFKKANQLIMDALDAVQEFDTSWQTTMEKQAAASDALNPFAEWWLNTFPVALTVNWAAKYLHERGVSNEIATKLDLRADPTQGRVCFPVRAFNGTLYGFHGRALDPEVDPRYRMYKQAGHTNPLVWLGEHWVNRDKPIVIVEGPFDLTSVLRCYDNVVSPLFAMPSEAKLKRMGGAMEMISLLDRGTGGDKGRERLTKLFGKTHVVKHLMPPSGRKDPGEMTKDEVYDLLYDHVTLTAP